jgi:hypothetical protein
VGLDIVEVFMAAEERFQITIRDEEAQAADTPGKLADLIVRKSEGRWTREQLWPVLREFITEQTGTVSFDENSHWVRDMHLD